MSLDSTTSPGSSPGTSRSTSIYAPSVPARVADGARAGVPADAVPSDGVWPHAPSPNAAHVASGVASVAVRTAHDADASAAERCARFLTPPVMTRGVLDPDVTEILCNPPDGRVWFDTRSRGKIDAGLALDATRVEMFLNAVAAHRGRRLDAEHPMLEAELPRSRFLGARLQGFVPPVTAGPAFVLRKPPTVVYPLASYVERGALSAAWHRVLTAAVRAQETILIVGGTNTGKTTLANAILREIATECPGERVVILEDTVELQCTAADHLALRTAPGATPPVTLRDLVRATLRAAPNRVVVGEVRGAEALDLLDAWATGHPGGVATLHGETVEGALLRLDRLAQRGGAGTSRSSAGTGAPSSAPLPSQTALIAEAVRLVVVLAGGTGTGAGGRRVVALARVTGCTPDGRFLVHHYAPESDR